jgi:outer membrane receptor protein involved in Fe transport
MFKYRYILSLCFIFIFSLNTLAQSGEIEEIITTATKTEKTLQEVPVAVSVISADEIDKANVVDAFDLMQVVPSLDTRQYQSSKNAAFFIRGFGNGSNNNGVEPSVALFVDGVYRSKMQSRINDLPMVERVEVLRGPQSTLFGKNATAGVINIITKKPSFEKFGKISTSFGNYNSRVVKAYYTAPLSDTMAFSLNANTNQADGHAKNTVTGNDTNNRDRYSLRADLLIETADDLEIRITADYDEYDEFCCQVGNVSAGPAKELAYALGAQAAPNNPFTDQVHFNFDSFSKGENSGISVNIVKEMENMTFTSITSSRDSDNLESQDIDFDSAMILNPNTTNVNLKAKSQEFRLASKGNERINWLIGAYYYDEDLKNDSSVIFGPVWRTYADVLTAGLTGGAATLDGVGALIGLPGSQIFATGQGTVGYFTQKTETKTFFGQIDINLTENMSAILGASYIEDEKQATGIDINTDIFSQVGFVGVGTFGLIQAGFDPATAAALAANPETNALLGFQALQFIPEMPQFPNVGQSGQSSDDNIDYTAKLTYMLNDDVSFYGGVSTGFKSSAWNLSTNSLPDLAERAALAAAGTPVAENTGIGQRYASPEEAEVFELGMKMRLSTGYFNLTAFSQEIKDFQSNTFVSSGFILANAGLQSSEGFEFDLLFSPVPSIDITFGGLVMDSKYDSFPAQLQVT